MNTFKQKSLYVALAGVSALGVTGAAQAVSVNPDGLGQALIYPYYTVRDKVAGAPFTSLLSVVNSTASAKAVKVRFLEGKNSKEVLDFNLYLSKYDVWVAAIIPTAAGAGIYTPDKSCTTPVVSSDASNPTPFVNYAYTGSAADGADTSLDRTREGYVEIIEMGNILAGSTTEAAVTHTAGVPDCAPLSSASLHTVAGNGGLFGGMTLINVLAGEDFSVDATALEGFSTLPLWAPAGSVDPTLSFVNPKVSVVTSGANTFVTDWTQQNVNYFRAIQIEKRMMFIILTLIIAVAMFNIVSALVMVVTDKQADIAILRTLGATPASIMGMFFVQGAVIGTLGTLLGMLGGVSLALNVETIVPFIENLFDMHFLDPGVYYISTFPSDMHWQDVWKVCGMAFVLSLLATIYPSWRASRVQPAEALRYE